LKSASAIRRVSMSAAITWGLSRAAVLGLATVGMTAGALAGRADAAIGPVEPYFHVIFLRENPTGNTCLISVGGYVSMSQAEAQNLLSSGYKVVVRLWGDDPVSDDLLGGPYTLTRTNGRLRFGVVPSPTREGLVFDVRRYTAANLLNEDAFVSYEGDEVYAGVRLMDPAGRTIRAAETKRVTGTFGEIPPGLRSDNRCT
jgi:hypothetical protein